MGDTDNLLMQLVGAFALLPGTGPGGTRFVARYPAGAVVNFGDWPAEPVARAAAAALATALAESGTAPLEGCVEELQDVTSEAGYLVSSRRVHASPEAFAHPPSCAAASLPELEALDGGTAEVAAVLLTHVFALPGDAQQPVRLATLLTFKERPGPGPARLLATVFGAGAHVALSSLEDSVYTDVSLGDAGSLSAEALAALPSAKRDALRAALRTQRISATAACLEAGWSSGFCALQSGVAAMKPVLGPALAALVSRLVAPQSGGPTRDSVNALKEEGETLEAAGRFMEASALYKECLQADARNPGARLLPTPPQTWSYYGLALKRAGRYREARAAYEAGLRALQTRPVEPDTPEWRETQRLELYGFLATLGQTMGDQAVSWKAYDQIFWAQINLFNAAGENAVFGAGGNMKIAGITSGRCFGVVERQEIEGVHRGLLLSRIEELPRMDPRSLPRTVPAWQQQPAQQAEANARSKARRLLQGRDAAAVPKLAREARQRLAKQLARPRRNRRGVCQRRRRRGRTMGWR